MSEKSRHIETLAIHAGQEPDPVSGAVMTPIVLASTFAQDGPGEHKGFEYARTGNPTRQTLERCLAALEGATHDVARAVAQDVTDGVHDLYHSASGATF